MRRWLTALVILILLGVIYFLYTNQGGNLATRQGGEGAAVEEQATPLPVVQTPNEIVAEAVVVPIQYAALSTSSSGIVSEILVQEGDVVEPGQLLARLDNQRQLLNVAQAEAQIRSIEARVRELQSGSRGEDIAAAQAAVDAAQSRLAQLSEAARTEDVDAARASVAAAQANYNEVLSGADDADLVNALVNLRNAEAERSRAQRAYNEIKWRPDVGALPQAASLQTATNNYEAAQSRYSLLAAGANQNQIAAAQAEVTRAQATLDKTLAPGSPNEIAAQQAEVRRAQAQLDLVRSGTRSETIDGAQADLASSQITLLQRRVELEDTELRAPFGGTVAALNLRLGEQVQSGAPVVDLADFSEWIIETDDLTEIGVVDIAEGNLVEIDIDAIPDLSLTGRVARIKPLGENKQGDITYTATIIPDSIDPRLRWRMTAAVTILPE